MPNDFPFRHWKAGGGFKFRRAPLKEVASITSRAGSSDTMTDRVIKVCSISYGRVCPVQAVKRLISIDWPFSVVNKNENPTSSWHEIEMRSTRMTLTMNVISERRVAPWPVSGKELYPVVWVRGWFCWFDRRPSTDNEISTFHTMVQMDPVNCIHLNLSLTFRLVSEYEEQEQLYGAEGA